MSFVLKKLRLDKRAWLPEITTLLIIFSALPCVIAQNIEKRLEQAVTLIQNNRLAEAEQQLNSILKVSPNQAPALNPLGTIRATQGRLDDAETLFTRAIRLDNLLTGAHMNLAYLYLLRNAPEKAAAELKAVLNLNPGNEEALYKLARLLLFQGRLDECITLIVQAGKAESVAFAVALGDAYAKK